MMEAHKKEEALKVDLQLLRASLAQKDEIIDTMSRERSQKEVRRLFLTAPGVRTYSPPSPSAERRKAGALPTPRRL